MPTNDDQLFAEHAVRLGFLTSEQVEASVSVQARMEEMGVRDSLRNVLVNRGALTEETAAIVTKAAGLAPGRDPIPGFTLEARLGAGAMGSVYKAWQKGMQRHVAVKILRRDLTSDARQVERLRREAALVGKLDHPNIVRGLDSGESNGLVWFAMEYVEGETLRERIRRAGPLPPEEAVPVARHLAEALEHAASQGIVHRDIKPGNVLLTKQGVPRLSDYGLAKGQTDDALTAIDATLGTPQYVAPEQARNPRDADIRSDVYSLGATLYTMLSGRPPFEGETLAQTLTKVLYERPVPLRELVPGVPEAVAYVVERMMAKERRHRYATPSALLHDLKSLEAGRLRVPAGFTGDIATFEESRRSRRFWAAGLGVVAAATLLAAGVLWWDRTSAAREREEKARDAFDDTLVLAGPEAAWDGRTVLEMLRRLERVQTEYVGTEAAADAFAESGGWRKEERELLRVQDLARRADASDGEWTTIIAQLDEQLRALRDEPHAVVARRQAADTLTMLRERRDRRARREIEEFRAGPAQPTLADAARAWTAQAAALRSKWYAGAASPVVEEAEKIATRFEEATSRLDARFAPWDAAAARGGPLERFVLAEAAAALREVDRALAADADLAAMLAALDPPGRWAAAATVRREAAGAALDAASLRAADNLRAEVERLLGRKAFDEALTRIDAFADGAPATQAEAVADLRARVVSERAAEAAGARDVVEAAALRFLDAYGRFDAARAESVLAGLETTLASRGRPDPAGAAFLTAARRLLDATERCVWERFRAGVAQYAAQGGELTDRRTGIRYRGIGGVRAGRTELEFTYGTGQIWKGSVTDIALDDVIAAGAVRMEDPDSGLAVAALKIAQYRIPADPRAGLVALGVLQPWLQSARAAEGAGAIVDRLAALHEQRVAETRKEIDEVESAARRIREGAQRALAEGRGDLAADGLRSLLDLPRLSRTEYVLQRRDEIRREIGQAEHTRRTGSVAARFPGARLTERADGTAEIMFDFEDPLFQRPGGLAVLNVAEGRVEIGSRLRVVTDRPARIGTVAAAPVLLDHVLAWTPADEQGAPRDAPLRIDCPFLPRKAVEVSFLCRSDRPFFLAVSVCGATAGVLSASESIQAGRGTSIWSATDLDRPDLSFDPRTRYAWIEANPAAVRKEADTTFFQLETGRVHRVRVVKDVLRTQLWVDGRLRCEEPVRFQPGPLQDRIVLLTHGPLDVDDLRIAGTLDTEWPRRK